MEGNIQYPLYHSIRTNKTADQIKKEGICTFGTNVDMKKEIINALKYFGKEKLATVEKGKGFLVQSMIREMSGKRRRNIYATTNKEAGCKWWAHANPELVSLALNHVEIPPDKIDKYLSEKFGDKCYNIKLKMTSIYPDPNFNTGLDCIPPHFIDTIDKCKECKYTGKEHKY